MISTGIRGAGNVARVRGGAALQNLLALFTIGAAGGLTDGELLGLFTTRHG